MRLLVVGLPNVGKSTLINALRRTYSGKGTYYTASYLHSHMCMSIGKCAVVGSQPGITRNVGTQIKINEDPPVYILDSPGIMIPSINDGDVAMKIAAIGALKDDHVGEDVIADYILYSLNRRQNFTFVPTEDDAVHLTRPYGQVCGQTQAYRALRRHPLCA